MATTAAARQTISYLTRRFSEAGIRPGTGHGQNFLIDMNLQELIVQRAAIEPADVVLEVGTGTGALTALMAARAAAVVTVEIDPRLYQLAREELIPFANVTMLNVDALKNKSRLQPVVVEAIDGQLATTEGRSLKLVANLPYNIATPVIANLLSSSVVPRSMTVTVQKEVADRITARPGSSDYGALSVWIQSQCRVELVRTLPPAVFWPRPKVNSAIIHVELDASRRQAIGDLAAFHDFVRSIFSHRRKFLRGVLTSALSGKLDKAGVDDLLARSALAPNLRAEQLDLQQIISLAHEAEMMIRERTS
jgi:16S rRNA (adenine1518-N6/adenine1519-N6)-dimethyltransferase